jgi:hypothetical protein
MFAVSAEPCMGVLVIQVRRVEQRDKNVYVKQGDALTN